jgi:hypothetical protein
MTKAVFLVYFSHARWWIDLDGKATGPFATRAAAIVEAIPMAQALQGAGRAAEVLAPGDDRQHHVAWPPGTERHRAAPNLAG